MDGYVYLRGLQPVAGYSNDGIEGLVDTSAYGVPGEHWCRLDHVSPGTASIYPFKLQVPGKGVGQWSAAEVKAWRCSESMWGARSAQS